MSEWYGLHNPKRHTPDVPAWYGQTACWECPDAPCSPEYPCRCCLAAEVEALRAQVQRVRDTVDYFSKGYYREYDEQGIRIDLDPAHVAGEITRALDGDSDE